MKNNRFYFTLFSFFVMSCSGGGSEDSSPAPAPTPPEVTNTAPSVPTLVSPTLAKLCISNSVVFEWTVSVDAEKNPIVYQLQIATDNQFTQIISATEVSTPTQSVTLDKGKAYYWRVKATDSKGASSVYSSVFSFYTEGVASSNHAPFLPQLVSPLNNLAVAGTSVSLKWSGSDVDVNDVLFFDVYLGTEVSPITKIVDNKSSASFDITVLPAKFYYWKVVVRDNKGGETTGQIWSFRTN